MARSPLERIALHQTRLRTPGLALDPSGVALGSKGLVLLPSIERLVAFLSIYTRDRSFSDVLASGGEKIEVAVVKSKLGTREVVVVLPAASTTLLDVVADVARLAGGSTFTGSGRYYVQYRDRSAPFGYDVIELLRADDGVDFALHHVSFTQTYGRERAVDLATLVVRLEPRRDPTIRAREQRPLWISAEPGIAAALVEYFARSSVPAEVGVIELPPESSFDDAPRRVALFRLESLPPRLEQLVTSTPGIRAYAPTAPGVAVEVGHRHPIHLNGLPVFPSDGLVLLPAAHPGETRAPIVAPKLPKMGPVEALVGLTLGEVKIGLAQAGIEASEMSVPLRLAPSVAGVSQVIAAIIPLERAPLLRRLAYALPSSSVEAASIARIASREIGEALLLKIPSGVDAIPLGTFFSERAPGLFVIAGHDLVPACAPAHLARSLGASASSNVFVWRDAGDPLDRVRAIAIDASLFIPLGSALVEPETWGALMPVEVVELARAELEEKLGTVSMGDLGLAPLRGLG